MFPEVKKLTVQHNTLVALLYQSKENNKKALEGRLSSSPHYTAEYGVQSHNAFGSVLPNQKAGADSPGPASVTGEIAKPTERHLPAVTRP